MGIKVGRQISIVCTIIGDGVEFRGLQKGTGTIVFCRGNIRIKLDEQAGGRRYVYLDDGWEKCK